MSPELEVRVIRFLENVRDGRVPERGNYPATADVLIRALMNDAQSILTAGDEVFCETCGDLRSHCTGEDDGEAVCQDCGETFNARESGSLDYCLRCLPDEDA